jgi:hypothetical protein
VLGHSAQPIGNCAAERTRELAADRYAVGLSRPPTGLFGEIELSPKLREIPLDFTIGSGLQLFVVQTHRLTQLADGDNCAYPTFAERLQSARAFEEQAFSNR